MARSRSAKACFILSAYQAAWPRLTSASATSLGAFHAALIKASQAAMRCSGEKALSSAAQTAALALPWAPAGDAANAASRQRTTRGGMVCRTVVYLLQIGSDYRAYSIAAVTFITEQGEVNKDSKASH